MVSSSRESQTTKSLRRFVEEQYGLGAIHTGRSQVGIERMPTEAVELRELVQRLATTSGLRCEGTYVESDEEGPRDGYEEMSVGRKGSGHSRRRFAGCFILAGKGRSMGWD